MAIDWKKIVKEADEKTAKHFESEISSLTRLNDQEINTIIEENGISNKDLASVLKEVKHATKSNKDKAIAIKNITKGVDVLVGLASKLV